jgi:hypothetical protein
MVTVPRALFAACAFALSPALVHAGAPPRALHASVCELTSHASFYDHKAVIVKADVSGSGLHAPKLGDLHCVSAPGIKVSDDASANGSHLDQLESMIRSAFATSTAEVHRHVKAIFYGTFVAHSEEAPDGELLLRDVYSPSIIEGKDAVLPIPLPPAR